MSFERGERWPCPDTGLVLLEAHHAIGYHVGKRGFDAVSAVTRRPFSPRPLWGRFDIAGETYYTGENPATAFAEVLAPFRRSIDGQDPLAVEAEAQGTTLEAFVQVVQDEWKENKFHGMGVLPSEWRATRQIHAVETMAMDFLVDVEHPDTIGSIEKLLGEKLYEAGVSYLTTSDLRGDNRKLTTMVAYRISTTTVYSIDTPVGVHFASKHGYGWCQAYWLRRASRRVDGDYMKVLTSESIESDDQSLDAVARRFGIRVY